VANFYETAMRYFAAGDYKQAKQYFEKVLVVDPNHLEAREQLTRTEKLLNDAKRAEEERARMEVLRPVYNAALTAFQRKNYGEALAKFEEMLQLDPENTEVKRYRILCQELLAKEAYDAANKAAQEGNWSVAGDQYKLALRYKPDHKGAQAALEKVRNQIGEQKRAESQRFYKEGLEAFLSGDQDKAAQLWQKAIDIDPDNLEAKRGLERVTSRRGSGQ
jgi:tetratricopeptide (TPR) repeat protein